VKWWLLTTTLAEMCVQARKRIEKNNREMGCLFNSEMLLPCCLAGARQRYIQFRVVARDYAFGFSVGLERCWCDLG
jgi:hypothetical protein